jgi:hypothetical protein
MTGVLWKLLQNQQVLLQATDVIMENPMGLEPKVVGICFGS